jgi:hypothetical protein
MPIGHTGEVCPFFPLRIAHSRRISCCSRIGCDDGPRGFSPQSFFLCWRSAGESPRRIILDAPHEGTVALRKGLRVSYLAQNQPEWAGSAATLYDRLAFGLAELRELGNKLAEAEAKMADPAWTGDADRLAELLDRYAEWQESFERSGGYGMDSHIRQVAAGLGFAEDRFGAPYAGLSGGEKTKAG